MDLTVRQIEVLLALGEYGGFTRAGQALGLTQSAVSRAIAGFEHRLGAPLVHRAPGGVSLTALGRQVAEHAHAAVEHLHAIETLAAGADAPRLRVGAVASALVRLVPDALARLAEEWPSGNVLTVQGDDDELACWLAAETIDLAVTTRPDQQPAAEVTDEFLAVLPSRHRLARSERIGLAELVGIVH